MVTSTSFLIHWIIIDYWNCLTKEHIMWTNWCRCRGNHEKAFHINDLLGGPPPVICGFPSQAVNNVELRGSPCCQPGQTIEQTVASLVIWDAMALMWHHLCFLEQSSTFPTYWGEHPPDPKVWGADNQWLLVERTNPFNCETINSTVPP